MKRTLLSVLLGLGLVGCGSSAGPFQFAGGNTGSNQSAGQDAPPAVAFRGRVVIRPVAITEENERAELVQFKSQFETDGLRLSPDGQFVLWPESPASGWTAELGSQSVLVDVDGTFAFLTPTDGATEGILRHPSDPNVSYRFTTAQLGQAGVSPIIMLSFFKGSCGMDEADTEVFCAPDPPLAPRSSQVTARVEVDPATLRPARRPFQVSRKMTAGPLGSEPNPNIRRDISDLVRKCPDTDGVFQITNLPVVGHQAKYLYSTCHDFVQTNACLNENNLSDLEALLNPAGIAVLRAALLQERVATDLILPRITGARSFNLHCYQNHKHRHCGQINIGDIVCKLPDGKVIKPTSGSLAITTLLESIGLDVTGFATVDVESAAPVSITIHNNGAFGVTKVRKIKNDLKGSLSGDSIPVKDGPQEIRHFNPITYEPPQDNQGDQDADQYVADRTIRYTPPLEMAPGQQDSYVFLVDDRYVVITFKAVALGPFLRRLGSTSEVTVQDLNEAGTMTTLRDGKTLLEPLGQDRVELLAEPGGALLNDAGHCLYQATDHQSHAKLRFPDGQELALEPPAGSLSTFADGVVSLSPQGFYFCKAKRADGKNDFFTQVEGAVGKDFLRAPEGLSPSSEVTPLTDTTTDALYANAPGGTAVDPSPFAGLSNAGKLVRFDFATRTWTSEIVPLRPDFLPGDLTGARYVDVCSDNVLYTESGENWYRTPPAGISWVHFFFVLIQNGGRETEHRKSEIRGPGARTVFASEDPLYDDNRDPIAAGTSHTVVALNKALEVVGTITEAKVTRPVFFENGNSIDLIPLLPAGAPSGNWRPLKMAGRYLVLQHTDGAGVSSVYLWFRGTE